MNAVGAITLSELVLYAAAFIVTAFGIGVVRRMLVQRQVMDIPNDRSSHVEPTPRGAGLAMLLVLAPAWMALAGQDLGTGQAANLATPLIAGFAILLLGGVSWLDDLRGLSPLTRLLAHAAAAIAGTWLLPGSVFGSLLPVYIAWPLTVIALIWFINLFNFMDGIDAISGVESCIITGGLIAISVVVSNLGQAESLALIILASSCGYLVWNWPPARIFLGDVGSVPLGFLLGWLLLDLAAEGYWLSALILPLYYLIDSGLTLGRRVLRGENIAVAHKSHFYQRAIQHGRSHRAVSLAVLIVGLILIAHAVFAAAFPPTKIWPALASATACVTILLVWMSASPRA